MPSFLIYKWDRSVQRQDLARMRSAALFCDAKPSRRLYLVGAGISVDEPSGVAGVPALLDIIFAGMETRGASTRDVFWRATHAPLHNPFGALRFETVIQALVEAVPATQDVLPLMAMHGEPNDCHRFLADELAAGATVLTTNFDRRIEVACKQQHGSCEPFILSPRRRVPSARDRFIKLHGTFGGGAAPRATLLEIGLLGLGFSNFPGFRRWLEAKSANCDLIVMGYSASDHFDVVPLIEETIKPQRVYWMDYHPTTSGVRWKSSNSSHDGTIPRRRGLEFPSVLLAGLASRNPGVQIWRGRTRSATAFVRALDMKPVSVTRPPPASMTGPMRVSSDNVRALQRQLQETQIGAYERKKFARILLEEDPFGAYLGVDFEKSSKEESTAQGKDFFEAATRDISRYGVEDAKKKLARLDGKPKSPRQKANYFAKKYYFETLGEDDATMFEAAKGLVSADVNCGAYSQLRGNDLLLMMLEDIFEGASRRRNLRVMRSIATYVGQVFRSTGQIGAGVQAFLMEARLRHRETLHYAQRAGRRVRSLKAGLKAARSAAYYSIRTGRDEVIEQAVWLYAFFLESAGARTDAVSLLDNYVDWIADEAVETKGATLTNLALMFARQGDTGDARRYLRKLRTLEEERWSEKPIFLAVVEAQISIADGRLPRAQRWIKSAQALVDRLAPDDPWRHHEELRLMEDQLGSASGVARAGGVSRKRRSELG